MTHGPDPVLLSGARPYGGEPVDILLSDGLIAGIGAVGSLDVGSLETPGAERVDCGGRWIGPGLWDEHVHFTQWVATRERLDLSDAHSPGEALAGVAEALRADPASDAVLFAGGMKRMLWDEQPSAALLDAVAPHRPVVIVGVDLHSGWINSAAARLAGIELDPSGIVRENEFFAALGSPAFKAAPALESYADAQREMARRGLVGVIDFENTDNPAEWPGRISGGADLLRVVASVWPEHLDRAIARGQRSGQALEASGLVTMGPLKVIVDGAINTRSAWLNEPYPAAPGEDPHYGIENVPHDELVRLVSAAKEAGIWAAVHAIGDRALASVLDAFEETGAAGRVEHAQLLGAGDASRMAGLGIGACVQPEHAMDDRDVVDVAWPGRSDRAFAFRTMLAAGVRVVLGSDAPVAPPDPWEAIASAVWRTRDDQEPWQPQEAIGLAEALAASARTTLEVGQPADLILTDADPLTADRDTVRGMPVAATLVGGRFTWRGI